MENQRNPSDENMFGRDTRDDFSSGPLMPAEREDAKNEHEDEDESRWDDEADLNDDLDDE